LSDAEYCVFLDEFRDFGACNSPIDIRSCERATCLTFLRPSEPSRISIGVDIFDIEPDDFARPLENTRHRRHCSPLIGMNEFLHVSASFTADRKLDFVALNGYFVD